MREFGEIAQSVVRDAEKQIAKRKKVVKVKRSLRRVSRERTQGAPTVGERNVAARSHCDMPNGLEFYLDGGSAPEPDVDLTNVIPFPAWRIVKWPDEY